MPRRAWSIDRRGHRWEPDRLLHLQDGGSEPQVEQAFPRQGHVETPEAGTLEGGTGLFSGATGTGTGVVEGQGILWPIADQPGIHRLDRVPGQTSVLKVLPHRLRHHRRSFWEPVPQ
jgi:hypothetical protein